MATPGEQMIWAAREAKLQAQIARLTDKLEAVEAERDRAMKSCEQISVRLGERRMCLNCGKTRSASEPKDDLPECGSPEFPGLAACTWDATPEEAWQIWRDRACQWRAERDALAEALRRIVGQGERRDCTDLTLLAGCAQIARAALTRLAP
jgi:hypothetical protein